MQRLKYLPSLNDGGITTEQSNDRKYKTMLTPKI